MKIGLILALALALVAIGSAAYAEAMKITKIIKYFIFYPISLEVTSRYNLAGGLPG